MGEKEKDTYKNFRNWVVFDEDSGRDLKDLWEKDSVVGRMIQVMDLIKKLDKENRKIKKIKRTIEKIEKQLEPLIQSVLEGEEMTRGRDEAIFSAESLVERYETYIKGYEELEKRFEGGIPSLKHMVNYYENPITESSDSDIGTITEGVFHVIPKKDYLNNENYPFDYFNLFLRSKKTSNSKISAVIGYMRDDDLKEGLYFVTCSSSKKLISEAFPKVEDIFGVD